MFNKLFLSASLVVLFLLCSCSSSKKEEKEEEKNITSVSEVIAKEKKYRMVVGFVCEEPVSTFNEKIQRGVFDAGEELEMDIYYTGVPKGISGLQAQRSAVEKLINYSRVQALIICSHIADSLSEVIDEAIAKDIPVVFVNVWEGNKMLQGSIIGTDQKESGRLLARRLVELHPQFKRVEIFPYKDFLINHRERVDGFVGELNELKKDVRVTKNTFRSKEEGVDYLYTELPKVVEKTVNPDVIFCINAESCMATLRALQTQKKLGNIKLLGTGIDLLLYEAIKEGLILGTVVASPYDMGATAVRFLKKNQGNKDKFTMINSELFFIHKGNLGDEHIQRMLKRSYDLN